MRDDAPWQSPAASAAAPVAYQEPGRCELGGLVHSERGRGGNG
jgi:hypothetical protein